MKKKQINSSCIIYEGDCAKIVKKIENNSIKLIYGSPPYPNAKRDYGVWKEEEYIEYISKFLKPAILKLRDDGFMVINIKANRISKNDKSSSERSLIVEKLMLYLKETLKLYCVDIEIWIKSNPAPTGVKNACIDSYEYILWFSKSNKWELNIDNIRRAYSQITLNTYKNNIYKKRKNNLYVTKDKKIFPNEKGALPLNTNLDEIKRDVSKNQNKFLQNYFLMTNIVWGNTSSKRINHQAVQPEYLSKKYILACTKKGDIVLDPWLGSGTTGKVACELNRKFIGIELNPKFIDIAIDRIKEV